MNDNLKALAQKWRDDADEYEAIGCTGLASIKRDCADQLDATRLASGDGEVVAWKFWVDNPDSSLKPHWTGWSTAPGFRDLCERMGYRAEFAYTTPPAAVESDGVAK